MTPEDDGRRELAGVVQPRPCSCRFYGGGSRAVCAEFGKVLGKVRPADSAPRAHQGAIPAGSDRVRAAGRDGGTGRRAGLKIPCPKGREGSTPSPGTLSPPGATPGGAAWIRPIRFLTPHTTNGDSITSAAASAARANHTPTGSAGTPCTSGGRHVFPFPDGAPFGHTLSCSWLLIVAG